MENEARVVKGDVPPAGAGERLDTFAAELAEITRSRAGTLIRESCVFVDGTAQTKPGFRLKPGASVRVEIPPAAPAAA